MGEQKRERMSDRIGQFVAVPVSFVNDMRISPRAFRLFVVLRSYTSANDGRDLVFPGYETLRARCGFSSYTFVAEAVRELEKAGWIERHKRFGKSTHYFITQPVLQPSVEMDAAPVLQTGVASVLHPSVGTVLHPSVDYLEPENKNQKEQEVSPATAAARAAGIGSQPSQRIARNKTNRLAAASRMDELERHPAIAAHRRVCGIQPMTLEQAEMIVSRVNGTAETTWPVDLVAWVQGTRKDGQPFNLAAIERQLQWHTDAETRRKVRSPAASAPTLSESEYAELTAKMEAPL